MDPSTSQYNQDKQLTEIMTTPLKSTESEIMENTRNLSLTQVDKELSFTFSKPPKVQQKDIKSFRDNYSDLLKQ